jgi:hypothetical protein
MSPKKGNSWCIFSNFDGDVARYCDCERNRWETCVLDGRGGPAAGSSPPLGSLFEVCSTSHWSAWRGALSEGARCMCSGSAGRCTTTTTTQQPITHTHPVQSEKYRLASH